jgi:hypothetical protein
MSQRKNKLRVSLVSIRRVLEKHPPTLSAIQRLRDVDHPPRQLSVKPWNQSL